MNDITVTQTVLFPDLVAKPLVATFDHADASSDGGAILLKAADRRLGLIDALAAVLSDGRDATRVRHSVRDLLAQRIFGLACGHADANDADALADDPVHKLLLDRDPIDGPRLASQPTLSRFENAVSPRTLFRLGEALADTVIAQHRRRRPKARRITIDLDLTEDATHGAQQLALFNGFYGGWCYLPLVAFLTFDDEPRQYLVAALLRPGTAPAPVGVPGLLRRLLPKLWAAFPHARLRVRLDGGFATPAIFDLLEAAQVEYVVAMAKNPVLLAAAADALDAVRHEAADTGASARTYTETTYRAQSWPHARRVVIKAEVVAHPGKPLRDNPRFVVTNLPHAPATVYGQIYAARGDSENRLKELHHDLAFGRTSCSRFWANQLRVLLSAAAYVLLQELQRRAARRWGASGSRSSSSACRSCAPSAGSSSTSPARIRTPTRGAPSPVGSAPSLADPPDTRGHQPIRDPCPWATADRVYAPPRGGRVHALPHVATPATPFNGRSHAAQNSRDANRPLLKRLVNSPG